MAKGSSGAKKSKLVIIIVIVLMVVGCGVAAYFLAPRFFGDSKVEETEKVEVADLDEGKAEKPEKDKGKEERPKKVEERVVVPMKTFIVNVQGGGGRFLKVNIELEVENKATASEVKRRMAQLRDKLITILTEKKASEISTSEGKRKLRYEIIRRANGIIKSGKIKKVYFTDFVMQ